MKRNTKIFCAALALVLVFGAVVGGTLAWLMDKTESVVNTFTAGNVDITLTESDNLDLKMVPGNKIAKDPKVTVEGDSEDAWVFVKINESEFLDQYITYSVATGWTALDFDGNPDTNDGIYYREVAANTADQSFYVLSGDNTVVTVGGEDTTPYANGHVVVLNETGTMEFMDNSDYPTLTFTAYACQKANVADAATAWNLVKDLTA